MNDDPLPAITIADISTAEGNSGAHTASFTVTLSNPSFQSISVTLTTADGTAGAPCDYIAKTSTVTFSPSVVSATFAVVINRDTKSEPNEAFFVNLTNATNATIARAQAVGTIVDDDPPALVIDESSQRAIVSTQSPSSVTHSRS